MHISLLTTKTITLSHSTATADRTSIFFRLIQTVRFNGKKVNRIKFGCLSTGHQIMQICIQKKGWQSVVKWHLEGFMQLPSFSPIQMVKSFIAEIYFGQNPTVRWQLANNQQWHRNKFVIGVRKCDCFFSFILFSFHSFTVPQTVRGGDLNATDGYYCF